MPDLAVFRELGLPFWLAGGYAEPEQITAALEVGAAGVQVGTAFAYCEESGLHGCDEARGDRPQPGRSGEDLHGSGGIARPVSRSRWSSSRTASPIRLCTRSDPGSAIWDTCGRRTGERTARSGWRCPSEPVEDYVRKGGAEEDTIGRKCLCNALIANIGHPQVQRNGEIEQELITSGDDVADVARFLPPGRDTYSALDVIDYLLPTT